MKAIIQELNLRSEHVEPYGRNQAKVSLHALRAARTKPNHTSGKLILVSAITPTKAGEGKTTVSIGLAQGFKKNSDRVALALREPSLGPVFGRKGTATGGGASTLVPADSINLHFTGDFHAITSAHNLLAAAIDNALHFKSTRLVPERVLWRRVMDMNDRALREIQIGSNETLRKTGFDITAASEIMAALCLTTSTEDLQERLNRILVGFDSDMKPVFAVELGVTGSMMALLREALMPNLVQSVEGVPAFVHGGPFANIAHGCNSVMASQMALAHADYVVTEAGFAFDLGGEKFMDIKCRSSGLSPSAIVLVATLRALKMHGGVAEENLTRPDSLAVKAGLDNLKAHVEAARYFRRPVIVALNHFVHDTQEEQDVVISYCRDQNIPVSIANVFSEGGDGARELATLVKKACSQTSPSLPYVYELKDSIKVKIEKIVQTIYGGEGVDFSPEALAKIEWITKNGWSDLPICMAKTQDSLSDNPKLSGRPQKFRITVRDFEIANGAGFLVALTGKIFRMPALPKVPAAQKIHLSSNGEILGW
jgi:formate--tetrahydrofolate ligase